MNCHVQIWVETAAGVVGVAAAAVLEQVVPAVFSVPSSNRYAWLEISVSP